MGLSIALAKSLAKILDVVSISSYIVKHKGIDCGF